MFPGGKISGQSLDIRSRNITIEVAGSLVVESKWFTRGSGTGRFIESILLQYFRLNILTIEFCKFMLNKLLKGIYKVYMVLIILVNLTSS